jgi:hypothetical protein
MTWLIRDDITQHVLCRSVIRTALDPNTNSFRSEHIGTTNNFNPENGENHKPILSVSDLVTRNHYHSNTINQQWQEQR